MGISLQQPANVTHYFHSIFSPTWQKSLCALQLPLCSDTLLMGKTRWLGVFLGFFPHGDHISWSLCVSQSLKHDTAPIK